MTWHNPSVWCLLLLPLVGLLAWWVFSRKRMMVRFSSTESAQLVKPTMRIYLRWLPNTLRILAIVLIVVSLARPEVGKQESKITSEGIAIEMVIDRSGSMQAMDFTLNGKQVDRLTAVKDVARKFIQGDAETGLEGREQDEIGLVQFAQYADNVCSLTLNESFLLEKLRGIEIVTQRSEDGTAIGDAIGLAAERLKSLKPREVNEDGEKVKKPVKSKIIILLTDGVNNAGDLTPVQAAELAKTLGVKIYIIGVGTRGRAEVPVVDRFGRQYKQWVKVSIDEDTLREIAKITGGKYFRATDTDSLKMIYAQIDQLEKTPIERKTWNNYKEMAIQTTLWAGFTFHPLLLVAFGLLMVDILLRTTYLRRMTG